MPGLPAGGRWTVGELVVGVEVPLEADQRHDRAVLTPRGIQIGNVDADVSEHLSDANSRSQATGGSAVGGDNGTLVNDEALTCGLGASPEDRNERQLLPWIWSSSCP